MWEGRGGTGAGGVGVRVVENPLFMEVDSLPRSAKFYTLLHSDPNIPSTAPIGAGPDGDEYFRNSSASVGNHGYYAERHPMSAEGSPYTTPWNQASPYTRSPWSRTAAPVAPVTDDSATFAPATGLIGSLLREEGHIYSLAAAGDLLYTGSDSKNIRVWKNLEEFSGFKSNSGLVKAIVIAGERIFTGHQDGKIRVWGVSKRKPAAYKRVGALPTFRDLLKRSIKPGNYVQVRRNRNALWIRHSDAISCLSLHEEHGLLYSGSWDKTFKVWRIADSRCLESVRAHDDAVNAVVVGFDGLVFTGSADGAVKVWQRELLGKVTKHTAVQTLLKQESAVTALAVNPTAPAVYCGSSDGLINFWERKKQLTHGGVLRGHKQAVLCMAAAGNLVLSGSADKTICIWRRDEGVHSCLSVLNGHAGPVKCLAIKRDRESLPADPRWIVYSGSLDKSVKVWRVSETPTHDYFYPPQEEASSGVASAYGSGPGAEATYQEPAAATAGVGSGARWSVASARGTETRTSRF